MLNAVRTAYNEARKEMAIRAKDFQPSELENYIDVSFESSRSNCRKKRNEIICSDVEQETEIEFEANIKMVTRIAYKDQVTFVLIETRDLRPENKTDRPEICCWNVWPGED